MSELAGAPCWIELFTSDPERSHDFYGRLFGWTTKHMGEEYGGYVNFLADGRLVGGCMRNDGSAGTPDLWTVYFETADVEALAEAATAHGGTVLTPPMQVMDLGSMVVVADPGSAPSGGWQPGLHTGFEAVDGPGTPAWFELHTRDYEASVAFYRRAFGWQTSVASDEPEFRYTTLGEGEAQRAGIMDASAFLPDGVPAHWSIYFRVDDVDAALARVVDLGGSVREAPQDTPYGRLASATDPAGAAFKLLQP